MAKDNYTITTPASELPVTLTEAKAWCVVEHTADDALITALIATATEMCEKYTNRVFVQRTFNGVFQWLDATRFEKYPFLEIRRAPLQSVTSINQTIDDAQVAFTDFEVKLGSAFSRVLFKTLDVVDSVAYPYEINFVAGYGTKADVPEAIKTAIKEMVCFMYARRGDCDGDQKTLPIVARSLLSQYRIVNSFG